MYLEHFELNESPFSIAPDPRFLYMSARHREALAHLLYGLRAEGGFVCLTGEVGTGKTTLLRCLLAQIPEHVEVAFVLHPRVTVIELLQTVAEELGVRLPDDASSSKALIDRISAHLLEVNARGGSTVLIIDEAQNLTPDVLEQIRLLTNLETNARKLLRIILVGQPELATLLRQQALRQLAQRITARYHLEALGREEIAAYIHHRFRLARSRSNSEAVTPFTPGALRALHRRSGGIPRLVNVIADRALLGAYVENRRSVDRAVLLQAAGEVTGKPSPRRLPQRAPIFTTLACAGFAMVAMLGAALLTEDWTLPTPSITASSTSERAAPEAQAAAPGGRPPLIVSGSPQPSEQTGPTGDSASKLATLLRRANSVESPREGKRHSGPTPAARRTAALPAALAPLWRATPAQTRRRAFAALFTTWHTPAGTPTQAPCDAAAKLGLRCLTRMGGWATLHKLDRPAVLELWRAGAEEPRYVALIALTGERARLALGGDAMTVRREALDQLWRGRAQLLWQLPPGYRHALRPGDSGRAVAWLREQLAGALGERTARPQAAFDAALGRRVRRFQQRQGLRADGLAGPHTWIRLNSAQHLGVPRLARQHLAEG